MSSIRTAAAALLLTACAGSPDAAFEPDEAFPHDFALLPPVMTMAITSSVLAPNDPFHIYINDVATNARVYVLISNAGVGSGPCPGFLGGECLNIVQGSFLKRLRMPDGNTHNISADKFRLPNNTPAGTYHAQAVATLGGTVVGSEPVELVVGRPSWPISPFSFPFDNTSFVKEANIPAPTDTPCCRDFGRMSRDSIEHGTDEIDNALADLSAGFGTIVELQEGVDDAIADGRSVFLVDLSTSATGDLQASMFNGTWEGTTTWFLASSGAGTFDVSFDEFVGATGTPRNAFDTTELVGTDLTARAGTWQFALPLFGPAFDLDLRDVTFTATADIFPGGGMEITNGALSGYVTIDDFFRTYNTWFEDACGPCSGFVGELFQKVGGVWESSCLPDLDVSCPLEPNCLVLGGNDLFAGSICPIAGTVMFGLADIDLDGDPFTAREAASVGLGIRGVTGSVAGVLP